MTYVFLVVLAVLWGAFFVSWYRSRASQRVDSVARFSKHLSVLERATPGQVTPLRTVAPSERGVHRISSTPQLSRAATPSSDVAVVEATQRTITLSEAYRRRRTVLVGLVGTAAVTLVGGLIAGGVLLMLNLVVDVALVAYVALLVRAQRIGAERRSKVTYLTPATVRPTGSSADGGVVVARSAHGG